MRAEGRVREENSRRKLEETKKQEGWQEANVREQEARQRDEAWTPELARLPTDSGTTAKSTVISTYILFWANFFSVEVLS